ncbi:cyclopropane-fatty-acyl-phospholipid synthase family protein [Massilia sp. 9096]|uniref:SAM-dependent methyltransferase n=1 Tax=Massilia sp. 9096 TaxID=1500894 RepID=UPI000689FE0F|nr:class I SAM-dependent methyltransferase [Massilia sp. 9096]
MTGPAPRRLWHAFARQILQAPALRALLGQIAAFPLTLASTWCLARAGAGMGYLEVALLQGGWAALLAWRMALAPWWRAIQFLFPPALLLARGMADAAALPPAVFLGVFVVLLLIFWSTFRTQVPLFLSGREAWDLVAGLLPPRPLAVIDIGSGVGGLVLELARLRPDCDVTGIELAPLPWLAARVRAALGGSRARFLRGDYERLNLGHYDVVFAYLSPAAMSALWRKAQAEMKPGSLLLSYEFVIAERAPDRRFVTTNTGKTLFVWHI